MAPEVPTAAEGGYPELLMDNWLGLSGPAGLPATIVARLQAETFAALREPEIRRRMEERGIAGEPLDAAGFTVLVARQVREIGVVVASLGIRQD